MFSKYPMIEVEEALEIVVKSLPDLGEEMINIEDCEGRVLASRLASPIEFPPFRASVMDGYAVKSSETPAVFRVGEACRTGDGGNRMVSGFCNYITTGAAVPEEADAVIPIEEVKILEDSIEVPVCKQGQWIREIGSDIKKGEIIGEVDNVIAPQHLALIASTGITQVNVRRLPVVGVVSTGNELKDLGQSLGYGQIIDSNRAMLKLLLKQTGCIIKDFGIIRDEYEVLKAKMKEMSLECDFMVSSGGVSMGDRDYVKPILAEEGEVLFGRVNMKPGKPMTFGRLGRCLAFALPGNPVSCFVCFYLFVRFAIDKSLHRPPLPTVLVKLERPLKLDPRPEYQRVFLTLKANTFIACSTGAQQSSRLLSTVQANAILKLPSSATRSEISGEVPAILLSGFESHLSPNTILPASDHFTAKARIIKAGVLSISDRASRGEYEDKSGPLLIEKCRDVWKAQVVYELVPDEKERIKESLLRLSQVCDVVLTTGGTGFAQRDVTPEATREVIEREAPGLSTKMLIDGLKTTEFACLSRMVCGIRGTCIIINFPGSLSGISDCFSSLSSLLPHAIALLNPHT